MPSFTTVNKVDANGFISKYDVFKTREEADARIAELQQIAGYEDAFVVDNDATSVNGQLCFQSPSHFPVDIINKTVSFDQNAFDTDQYNKHMGLLRTERNNLLLATDIIVLPDRWALMDDVTKAAWANYRQALRDLPANTADPTDVTWPLEPGQIVAADTDLTDTSLVAADTDLTDTSP